MQIRMACYKDLMRILEKHRERQGLFFLTLEKGEEAEIAKLFPKVRVKPASRCRLDPNRGAVDRESGEVGMLLEIKSVSIHKADAARTYSGYFSGAATMFEMELIKSNKLWLVTNTVRRAVQ